MSRGGNKRGFMAILVIGMAMVGLLLLYTILSIPQTRNTFLRDGSSVPLTFQGRLIVLYVGSESCPFCAAERWAIVSALSHFGNWSNLQPSLSGPPSIEPALPNLPTYSFVNSSFSSSVISFQPVELQDRLGNPLQQLDQAQATLFTREDPSGSIPFLSLGGEYYKVGSGVNATLLSGLTFSEVLQSVSSGHGPVHDSVDVESQNIASTISLALQSGPNSDGSASTQNMVGVPPEVHAVEAAKFPAWRASLR